MLASVLVVGGFGSINLLCVKNPLGFLFVSGSPFVGPVLYLICTRAGLSLDDKRAPDPNANDDRIVRQSTEDADTLRDGG